MSWLRLVPALIWAGGIFIVSSMSSPPGAPGTEWASLLAHAAVFGVLALLLAWFVDSSPRLSAHSRLRRYTAVWLVAVLYGVSDEVHQAFVPGRHSTLIDVLADGAGAAAALSLWAVARRRYARSQASGRPAVPVPAGEDR